MPEFRPPVWAPTERDAGERRQSRPAVQLGAGARGRHRLGAQLEPAFVRHGAGARGRRAGDRQGVAASVDRQGAAAAGAAHRLRLPLRGAAPPHHQRRDARLCAIQRVRRPGHRADPAQQPLQRRQHQRADATTRTRRSTSSRGGIRRTRRIPKRGASSSASVSVWTSTRATGRCAPSRTTSGRTGSAMKAGNFTGITGFPNQDVAMWVTMGADHRPHDRSPRRERSRDRRVPQADGRRRCAPSGRASRRSARAPTPSRPTSARSRRSCPRRPIGALRGETRLGNPGAILEPTYEV